MGVHLSWLSLGSFQNYWFRLLLFFFLMICIQFFSSPLTHLIFQVCVSLPPINASKSLEVSCYSKHYRLHSFILTTFKTLLLNFIFFISLFFLFSKVGGWRIGSRLVL